jgi:hypothetical protein
VYKEIANFLVHFTDLFKNKRWSSEKQREDQAGPAAVATRLKARVFPEDQDMDLLKSTY